MREVLRGVEAEDVYEPPLLAEAGGYAEATRGSFDVVTEGPVAYDLS